MAVRDVRLPHLPGGPTTTLTGCRREAVEDAADRTGRIADGGGRSRRHDAAPDDEGVQVLRTQPTTDVQRFPTSITQCLLGGSVSQRCVHSLAHLSLP